MPTARKVVPEALIQTLDQQRNGTVTYRVYIDEAFRNGEVVKEWNYLTPDQLLELVEQVYWKNKQAKSL